MVLNLKLKQMKGFQFILRGEMMLSKSKTFEIVFNKESNKNEYLIILNDIHSILSNCSNLTNNQKLDYCNSQRYYMKLYLKEVLTNVNKQ